MDLTDAARLWAAGGTVAEPLPPAAHCAALFALPAAALAEWNRALCRDGAALRWSEAPMTDGSAPLGLVCAGRPARLTLTRWPYWTAQGVTLDELGGLPPPLRTAAYAQEAEPLLHALRAALAAEVELAEPPAPSARAWCLELRDQTSPGPAAVLHFEPADAAFWLRAAAFGRQAPRRPRFAAAPVAAELVLARLSIPPAHWSRLCAGGALLTALRAQTAVPACLRLPALTAQIDGVFEAARFQIKGRFAMSEASVRAPAVGLDDALAQAPVAVEVQLEVPPVPLAQLLHWVPGSVFELGPAAATGEVRLTANGAPYGRGRLVSLGDTLAVQVLQIDGDGSDAA